MGKRIMGIDLNLEPILGKINNIYNSWPPLTQNITGGIIVYVLIATLIRVYKFFVKKLRKNI